MNKIIKKKINVNAEKISVLMLILSILFFASFLNNINCPIKTCEHDDNNNEDLNISSSSSSLFEGTEEGLNVTDYGILTDINQEISISNQEEVDLSYSLDVDHDWEVSRIETSVKNIEDTRNWVHGSNFKEVQIYRVYEVFESAHDYANNNDPYSDIDHIITETGAYYLRVHFVNMSFDYQTDHTDSDFMVVMNGSLNEIFVSSGFREDFYSPWSIGESLFLSYQSNNNPSTRDYGYYIDYYEIINASSNLELNSINWKGNYEANPSYGSNTYGSGKIGGADAMFIGYHGSWYTSNIESYAFYAGTYTEIYQENINVPRGKVIDAYLSFDYYTQFALEANNIIMYMEINGLKVYSKGMLDLSSEGKNAWHKTGKVPMYLWENQSNVFDTGEINEQTLNVSFGIKKLGSNEAYTGYDDGNANVVWFDNVSLVLTTIANATQDGINLTLNSVNFEDQEHWGRSILNLTDVLSINPLILTLNSTSPDLTFNLNTTIYGFHKAITSYNQQYDEGVSYTILKDCTILWEVYHNLYMPSNYEDFEFVINKPSNWEFISVTDPFLQQREFEGGKVGDKYISINKSNAIFSGWYYLVAKSPNYININNTKVKDNTQWVNSATFNVGDTIQIRTQINCSNEIPSNLETTGAILTIYNPNGNTWYQETQSTILSNGTVRFSEILLTSLNSTGGQYNYTIFWSNGTALGGVQSSFLVVHGSDMTLLKPDDAISDLIADAFVGDIIPVRVNLSDAENGESISNGIISYNWTSGTILFEEAALGIYETILYTSDLDSNGLYEILIQSSKIGFLNCNFTLKINLGEETRLTRLQSDYDIELHANSTIKFRYFSEITGFGIDGATINVNITDSNLYFVKNKVGGYYDIEFNTSFIDELGIFQLNFNFTAPSYEPQTHIYQFRIIEQSTSIIARVDNQQVTQNSIIDVLYNEEIYVSARALAIIDNEFLSGGNFTWSINSHQEGLIESGDYWYNLSIQINPSIFSIGLNLLKLQFEKEKYQTEIFYFQLLVNAQPVELSAYVGTAEISEYQLLEVMFKQTITFSLRAYGTVDLTYISGAQVYWNSEFYSKQISENPSNWYNLSVTFTASNFSSGTNSVSIRFEKDNYTTTYFSFQLLIREQVVELNASINNEAINDEPIEVMLKENVTISAQAYAIGELIFLSGGNITLLSESFEIKLIETQPTWFTIEFIIDGAYFDLGINTISLKFEQENYTESYFAFQFFITAETVNLSLYMNSEEILTNNLIRVSYFEEFSLSLRAIANAEEIFLDGGSAVFLVGGFHQNFTENSNFWYNLTISCDPLNFELGINTIKISFEHPNYTSSTFYFQVLVQQIEIKVRTIDFQDSIDAYSGDSLIIQINLTEYISADDIENATISYSWEFGLGTFAYLNNGIYQINLNIPENVQGSYKVSLIISTEDIVYKVTQSSFIVVISPKELPDNFLLTVIIASTIVIGILSALSVRSYVIIPRRRKKEAELLSRTQDFKDLKNIQAIVLMHRYSGVPLFSKSYSILEKQKKELFAGFVQAITSIGEEIAGKNQNEEIVRKSKIQNLFELDFKYFYCLICDQEELRIVLVLAEKASENLKNNISNLATGIMLQIGDLIENWDGAIDTFEKAIPPILNQYFDFHIKEPFMLNDQDYVLKIRKEVELSKMENRVLNTVTSMIKSQSTFLLDYIVETVHEDNKDLIIEAIKSLISKKIIIPKLD